MLNVVMLSVAAPIIEMVVNDLYDQGILKGEVSLYL